MIHYVTLNGHTYSDGPDDEGTGIRYLDNGGHWDNLLPMFADVVVVAGYVATIGSQLAGMATGTSSTGLAIAIASKSFTTQAGIAGFVVGNYVRVQSRANPANFMYGKITSYSDTTLTIDVEIIGGSGTFDDWDIWLSGMRGAMGTADTTAITGILKGNGETTSAAVPGEDYQAPITGTGLLKGAGDGLVEEAVSGEDIKTVNGTSLLGAGNIATLQSSDIGVNVQAYSANLDAWAGLDPGDKQDTLVSGENIKTIDSVSLLGVGDIEIKDKTAQTGLLKGDGTNISAAGSGTDIKTVGGASLLGAGDVALPGKNAFTASGTIASAGLALTLLSDGEAAAIGGALSAKVAFVSSTLVAGSVSAAYDPTTQKVVVLYAVSSSFYAVVGTVSGGSITFGTPVTMDNSVSGTLVSRCAIEAGSGKVVVMYVDSGTTVSNRVGTISGTSISFGSTNAFSATAFDLCYCATSGKFVYVRSHNSASHYARAAVGTVSGTTISWGTEADIHATATVSNYICCTYDSTNDKVVAFYNRANVVYAAVGTVSGATISFGSEVTMYAGRGYYLSAAFDANAGKTVTAFVNTASDSRGRAIVGTVSGTSISFGTAAEFTANAVDGTSIAYDSTNHKLILSYGYADSPQYIKAVTGTISGTDITFGTAVNVTGSGYSGNTHAIVYDSDTNSAVVAYRELSNYGYGRVASMASGDISYASTNFVGLSEASAADGASVNVTTLGGVNTGVSGLTPGADYYVDSAGTLTTSATNNTLVGKALSATSLLVTGGAP
jgi:hypothetical protein